MWEFPLKVKEVPHHVSTGSRNLDEAHASEEKREIPLSYRLERTRDPSPPRAVKAILHDSFWGFLKARTIPSAFSASDLSMGGRRAPGLLVLQRGFEMWCNAAR